jgi:hypothetical protein
MGPKIFASVYGGGIFCSSNGGDEWIEVNNGLSNKYVKVMSVKDKSIFVGTDNGIFRSTDEGLHWSRLLSELKHNFIHGIAKNDSYIFVTNGLDGIYRSNDNGNNWVQVNKGLPPEPFEYSYQVTSLHEISPFLISGLYDGGVYLSSDNGDSWKHINNGFDINEITSVALIDSTIYIGTWEEGIWASPISSLLTDIKNEKYNKPIDFYLSQNYPNPFNPATTIEYEIPKQSNVKIDVFDALGRKIETLLNKEQTAGNYKMSFNGSKLSSGIYLYKLTAGSFVQIKKMILIK